ncbi:hypothetical protein A3K72_03990 [Candidatus Woesearchaeota archaeon RBG_13_36_6]|nr:MAG: hypothetical protein A3K72_03990 [Candidatus Woesearchaeota archaeon RBG_13_36_6]
MGLDEKDLKILEILKQNAKLTTSQISKKTKIPITTVYNRIKGLENGGVIKGYTVMLNHKLLGEEVLVYILVTVNYNVPGKKVSQEVIANQIKKSQNVEEVNITTGEKDIIVKARFGSISQLNDFVTKTLRNIEGVDKTQTMVVLSEI